MDLEKLTPTAVAKELGERLRLARLNVDLTQAEIAEKVGVTRKVIVAAEQGKTQLQNFVAILQALELSHQLEIFLPKQEVSPIQLAKLKGRKRKRASGRRITDEHTTRKVASTW